MMRPKHGEPALKEHLLFFTYLLFPCVVTYKQTRDRVQLLSLEGDIFIVFGFFFFFVFNFLQNHQKTKHGGAAAVDAAKVRLIIRQTSFLSC